MAGSLANIKLGDVFDRLTVIEFAGRDAKRNAKWLCRCACDKTVAVYQFNLTNGKTGSCGCRKRDAVTKHGKHLSRTYVSWQHMKTRCSDPKHPSFHRYGGRGISVCERWLSFENFLADMGERPAGRTLDRVDNDRGYEPGNCRWATPKEQVNNRSAA